MQRWLRLWAWKLSLKISLRALVKLKKECGVDNLKMSDYGITKDEIKKLAENAKYAMGGLFDMDRQKLSLR